LEDSSTSTDTVQIARAVGDAIEHIITRFGYLMTKMIVLVILVESQAPILGHVLLRVLASPEF